MLTNITVFALNNNYAKTVANHLADELEMFFADVMELLTFDLINIVEATELTGKDYVLRKEQSKIKTVSTYENTIISCDYRSLNNEVNYENLHAGSVMVYLKLNADALKKVNLEYRENNNIELFSDVRMELLEEKADVVCEVSNMDISQACDYVMEQIQKYYEK